MYVWNVEEYLKNPGCACNLNFYKKIINEAQTELSNYFPGREIQPEKIKIPENNFVVINCHVNELEQRLNKLLDYKCNETIIKIRNDTTYSQAQGSATQILDSLHNNPNEILQGDALQLLDIIRNMQRLLSVVEVIAKGKRMIYSSVIEKFFNL